MVYQKTINNGSKISDLIHKQAIQGDKIRFGTINDKYFKGGYTQCKLQMYVYARLVKKEK